MLYVANILPEPLETIPFLTVPPQGVEPVEYNLPIYHGTIEGLPATTDALVVASDLQGIVRKAGAELLLGEVVPDTLKLIFDVYFPALNCTNSTALLCGDLYTNLLKRGQSGNPIDVWRAFSRVFGATVGIAGNHDDFAPDDLPALRQLPGTQLMLNDISETSDLRIGGLSGIIGRADKPFRRPEAAYLQALEKLLARQPDIMLTHLSPAVAAAGLQGDERVTAAVRRGPPTVLCCGHSHWPGHQPVPLGHGTQVLNADAKVFLLTRPDPNRR